VITCDMAPSGDWRPRVYTAIAIVFTYGLFVGARIILSLYSHPDYGYFLDELYFLACSARLEFGYVDNPPFSHAILWLTVRLFGDSPLAIRIPSALAGGMCLLVAGASARRLGGGGDNCTRRPYPCLFLLAHHCS